jgi:hypothetical protein
MSAALQKQGEGGTCACTPCCPKGVMSGRVSEGASGNPLRPNFADRDKISVPSALSAGVVQWGSCQER